MKVVAMLKVYFYDLSLRKAMDAARFFSLVGLSLSLLRTLVSSPDQIFRVRPADSSKNRVWTLSLRKLGHVYIRRSVNWVIVGVNYIIRYQQRLLWRQKICKLAICDDVYAIYFT